MKRLMLHGVACLILTNVVLGSPDGVGAGARRAGASQAARVGREFKVRAGRVVTFEGENLWLKLASVAEDSRCPVDVDCVWAGNAEVLIEVGAKGGRGKKTLRLNTNAGGQRAGEGRYGRYTLKLLGLSPQPRQGRKIAAGEYTATLLVVKE